LALAGLVGDLFGEVDTIKRSDDMTKYPDGSILIWSDELTGVDGLISLARGTLRERNIFAEDAVMKFVRKWRELNVNYINNLVTMVEGRGGRGGISES
jgi:hypothetical protein